MKRSSYKPKRSVRSSVAVIGVPSPNQSKGRKVDGTESAGEHLVHPCSPWIYLPQDHPLRVVDQEADTWQIEWAPVPR